MLKDTPPMGAARTGRRSFLPSNIDTSVARIDGIVQQAHIQAPMSRGPLTLAANARPVANPPIPGTSPAQVLAVTHRADPAKPLHPFPGSFCESLSSAGSLLFM
jgi:hypothetical protein